MNPKSKSNKKNQKTTKKKVSANYGKIMLQMVISLDGYIAGPNNELDWMNRTLGNDSEDIKDNLEILKSYDAGIMGFPTVQGMVPFWQAVAEDPQASPMNHDIAKVVNNYYIYALSKQEESLPRDNAELIVARTDDEITEAVNGIKARTKKNLGVAGGVRTAQTLSRLGLIDEYVLTIHPVVIGSGKPLFTTKINLELLNSKTYKNGIIRSKYKPV